MTKIRNHKPPTVIPDLIRYPGAQALEAKLDSRLPDCVAIVRTAHVAVSSFRVFLRNPVLFQCVKQLDAGRRSRL